MYTSALREQVICINDTDFCRGSTKHYFKGAIQCIHTMFPEAACFKVRITSTVSFDLSVRHDECDDGGNAGGDFASVCVLGSEKWQSMNTDSLWLMMGWTGFIKPMNIERTAWPFLHLEHWHTARTNRIVCFALVWTGGGSCSWFQFYIYIYIYIFFFWVSHQFLSRTVGCMWNEDASYILAFIKKGNF